MKPRPYQAKLVDETLPALARQGHEFVVVCLPVGGGKTFVAAMVLEKVLRRDLFDVWVLEHRTELGFQFSEALRAFNPTWIRAGDKRSTGRVRIIGRDTLARREIVPEREMAYLVIDEVHVWACDSCRKQLDRFRSAYKKIVGIMLTATPYRLDGRPLGAIAQALVEPVTPADLFATGVIVEPQVIGSSAPDMQGASHIAGDFDPSVIFERSKGLRGDVLRDLDRWAEGRPAACRGSTVEHSLALRETLSAKFRVAHMDGTTSPAERNRILAMLSVGGRDSNFPGALDVVCVSRGGLLVEGWDPKSDYLRFLRLATLWGGKEDTEAEALRLIESGVMPPPYSPLSALSDCNPTESECAYRQFEGRVCRSSGDTVEVTLAGKTLHLPARPKKFARIVSHSSNWQRHGFLRDHHSFRLEQNPKERKKAISLAAFERARYCPECLSVWPSTRKECSCGAAMVQKSPVPVEDKKELRALPAGAVPTADKNARQQFLKNLWISLFRDNAQRIAEGKPPISAKRVGAIYKSYSRHWPNTLELEEARLAALAARPDLAPRKDES